MEIGIMYPSTELPATVGTVRSFTAAVEAMGYDYVSVGDHVLAASHDREKPLWGPYNETDAFHDPFVLISYMAAMTSNLGFTTGILILPQRQTAIVARQAADLAEFCAGRFRLGVGIGWSPIEYDALGQDFGSRGRRANQQLAMLRQLWTLDLVTASNDTETIDRACLNPRPAQPVPIWIGGGSDAAFKRAARHGHGFTFAEPVDTALIGAARVGDLVTSERGEGSGFGFELTMIPDMPRERRQRWPRNRPSHLPRTADVAERWRDAGGTHLTVFSTWMGLQEGGLDAHLEYAAAAIAEARSR